MGPRLLLPTLIAFNLVVKLLWLGTNELAHDEPFTVYWSQQPFPAIREMLRTENNPPLYFLLIKVWSTITPLDATWLRVPSAIFSALAVWPLWLLARRLGGMRAALVAALLFTLNNHHYGFAHEVRAYSLFTLLAIMGMWLLVRMREGARNRMGDVLPLALSNTLMVYTHFFGWLAIGVQALCVFLLPELRPLRRNFLLSAAATLALFAPYLVIFLQRTGASMAEGTWLAAPAPEELYNMIWRWSNAPVLAAAFLLAIAIGCARDRLRSPAMRLALLWSMVPLLGMFAISFAVPMFLDRYLVYAAPGFALLVPLSIGALRMPPRATAVLLAAAVAGMAFTFTPWKEGRYRPSGVYEQVRGFCGERCSVMVIPDWYWLNFTVGMSPDHLGNGLAQESVGGRWWWEPGRVIRTRSDTLADTVIVVCAGMPAIDRTWYYDLVGTRPMVDSVEADHRVWVYRFRR